MPAAHLPMGSWWLKRVGGNMGIYTPVAYGFDGTVIMRRYDFFKPDLTATILARPDDFLATTMTPATPLGDVWRLSGVEAEVLAYRTGPGYDRQTWRSWLRDWWPTGRTRQRRARRLERLEV